MPDNKNQVDIRHAYPVMMEGDHAFLTDKDCIEALDKMIAIFAGSLPGETLILNTYSKVKDYNAHKTLGYKQIGRYKIMVSRVVAYKVDIFEDFEEE